MDIHPNRSDVTAAKVSKATISDEYTHVTEPLLGDEKKVQPWRKQITSGGTIFDARCTT